MSIIDYSDAPRVVIESPFADPTPEGLAAKATYLRRCLADAFKRGEAPFASHGLYTLPGVLDDTIPDDRTRGITAGYAWAKVADRWVFYVDLGWSSGMRAALEFALRHRAHVEVRSFENEAAELAQIIATTPEEAIYEYLRVAAQSYWRSPTEPVLLR